MGTLGVFDLGSLLLHLLLQTPVFEVLYMFSSTVIFDSVFQECVSI